MNNQNTGRIAPENDRIAKALEETGVTPDGYTQFWGMRFGSCIDLKAALELPIKPAMQRKILGKIRKMGKYSKQYLSAYNQLAEKVSSGEAFPSKIAEVPEGIDGYSDFISDLFEQNDNLFDFLTVEQSATASVRDTLLLLYRDFKEGSPDMETIVPNILRLAIDTLSDQHERMSDLYMTMSEKFPEEYENSQLLNEEVEEYDDDESEGETYRVFTLKDSYSFGNGDKAIPTIPDRGIVAIRENIIGHAEEVKENAEKE